MGLSFAQDNMMNFLNLGFASVACFWVSVISYLRLWYSLKRVFFFFLECVALGYPSTVESSLEYENSEMISKCKRTL